ncbi:hypothetical protein [Actinomadura sp. 9N407]|uniref:hypothetical protein n=1 Tax=Actinomadura sp. 9N407 TaxID=3375154 RepID=UPI0037875DFA
MRSRQFGKGQRHGRSRSIAVVAVIAAMGLLGSGCSLEGLNPIAEPTRELPPDPSSPDGLPMSVNGIWEGTYTCNQGLTRLHLTLTHTSGERIAGILRFSADPSNPTVPTGSYNMSGTLAGGSLRLDGDSWINRPGVYQMVSLSAQLSPAKPDQIQGDVSGTGCSTFTVQRN